MHRQRDVRKLTPLVLPLFFLIERPMSISSTLKATDSMMLSHELLWEQCQNYFRANLPADQYENWFEPLFSMKYEGNELVIHLPSPFFKEYLEEHYARLIGSALFKFYGPKVKLLWNFDQIKNEPNTSVTMLSSNPSPAVRQPASSSVPNPLERQREVEFDSQLNPTYTFENYCHSGSNRVARSIGEAIASNSKLKTFNPLFIFGPPGVGKTHLIQAIGIRYKERNPEARVLYVTARLFESQYTAARDRINDFIAFYQSIDVLIIDDIQDLIGKSKTQNTFFHIFNHLHLNQKQIILSSDCSPSQMENMDGMEKRLLSRFKWGMTAELERPDINLRRDVLTLKAKQDGLVIPGDVLEFIATNVTESIRELEGIVVSLVAHATVLGQDINLDLARNVLANAVKYSPREINFDMVTEKVCEYYNIDRNQIYAKSRKREVADARQMIMYLAKKHVRMPLKSIGSRLNRTHATVLHGCRNIEERLPIEKQLAEDVSKIESMLQV